MCFFPFLCICQECIVYITYDHRHFLLDRPAKLQSCFITSWFFSVRIPNYILRSWKFPSIQTKTLLCQWLQITLFGETQHKNEKSLFRNALFQTEGPQGSCYSFSVTAQSYLMQMTPLGLGRQDNICTKKYHRTLFLCWVERIFWAGGE